MPTTEQIIKNRLQQVIACNAVEHSAVLTSAQAVVLMTSFLIEYRSSNKPEQQEIDSFLKVLSPECFKPKKKIQELSSLGFNDRCNALWNGISKINLQELKKRIENLQLSLITSIEDTCYLSFGKNLENFANVRCNKPYIWSISNSDLENDGKVSIHTPDQPAIVENNTPEIEHSTSTTQEDASESTIIAQNKESNVLAYRVAKVNNGEDLNKPFIQLYQELLNSQPNKNAPQYVWQWLLTQQQYDDITSCFSTNKLPSPSVIKPNTAKLLCLYIGEFYKREYDGNNSFPVQISQQLFSTLYEYQTIKSYRKVCNNTHLFTLYVSGGLPIHYLVNNNNQDQTLVKALAILLDPDSDEFDKEQGKQLLSRASSTVALYESYIQGHSIFEYTEMFRCGGKVWDKSDDSVLDFQKMSNFVQDYKSKLDEHFHKKFRTKYSLWIDSEQNAPETICPMICLYPEESGERHYALSKQRLNALSPCDEFDLCVKDGDSIVASLHFSICCNGDYIADDLQQAISLNSIPIADLPQKKYSIEIEYQDATNNKALESITLLPELGYLQFYTDDDPQYGASYVAPKGATAFRSSAVLYDSNKQKVESVDYANNDTSIQIPNSSLRWVLFKQCVTLVSVKNGKTKSLYNTQGRFYAIPKSNSFSKFDTTTSPVISNENHRYPCQLQNQEENRRPYLVKDTHIEFDLYKASVGKKLDDIHMVIKYRYQYDDPNDWVDYDSKTPLLQGYVQFQISLGTFKSIVECFVLAHDAKMEQERNGNTYRYRISNVTDVVSCHKGFTFNKLNNDIVGSGNNKKGNIDFSIGSTNGSGARLLLSAYNPHPSVVVTDTNGNPVTGDLIVTWSEWYSVKSINSGIYSKQNLSVQTTYNFLKQVLAAVILNNRKTPLGRQDLNVIDPHIMSNQRYIKAYTNLFSDKKDTAGMSFYVLDFKHSTIGKVQGTDSADILQNARKLVQSNGMQDGGLLFQSLKGAWLTDTYFKPEYIHYGRQGSVVNDVRRNCRTSRLTDYATKGKGYCTKEAYAQFEIACKHRLYFAELDRLLSMCWSQNSLIVPKPKRIYDFLYYYVAYCANLKKKCDIDGLRRLSREFQFDWKVIQKHVAEAIGLPITTKLQATYNDLIK